MNRTSTRERALITTLTKGTAEDLSDYLGDVGLRVRYLHSDIDTIERVEILMALRELQQKREMAAANLEYERAALLRDQIMELKDGTGISKIEPKRGPLKYGKKTNRRTARV